MARKAYIGVDGVARKIKQMYVGVSSETPIYETQTVNTNITADNIRDFFMVTNGTYYFKGNGSTFTTNNGGVSNSTATTVLTARKDIYVSFNYSYGSEDNYDLFTLIFGSQTIHNEVSGTAVTKSLSGSLSKGYTISFKYSKDGSQDKNGDACSFSNMIVATEEQIHVGTEHKSIARRIKKAYVGIGGVARPIASTNELRYYGEIAGLSNGLSNLAATSVGNYALFGGGKTNSIYSAVVDAYDRSLTRSSPTGLGTGRFNLAATTVGHYALFGGGEGSSYYANVDAYDESKTRSTPTSLTTTRSCLAAATVGNYALFGGGMNGSTKRTTVNAYDTSHTLTTPTSLSSGRYNLAAASVGDYVLFAGGYSTGHSSTVDAYNTSLVRTSPTELSRARSNPKGVTVGEYALFGGGGDDTTTYGFKVVDAYNRSLTRTIATSMSVEHNKHAATTIGEYALFAGGKNVYNTTHGVVDVYDKSLTLIKAPALNTARDSFAATTIGDFALCGGGYNSNSSMQYSVEAYVCEIPTITIKLVVSKTDGSTLYAASTQTVSIKAKAGMRYFNLAYADTNTIAIPDSNGNTLTIMLWNGKAAWRYTSSGGKVLTCYSDVITSGTWLTDGMTLNMVEESYNYADLDSTVWTIRT